MQVVTKTNALLAHSNRRMSPSMDWKHKEREKLRDRFSPRHERRSPPRRRVHSRSRSRFVSLFLLMSWRRGNWSRIGPRSICCRLWETKRQTPKTF